MATRVDATVTGGAADGMRRPEINPRRVEEDGDDDEARGGFGRARPEARSANRRARFGEVVANLAGDIETRVRDWRVGRRTSNN